MRTGPTSSEELHFLQAIKAGDLETVRRMVQRNRHLLFITAYPYSSPANSAAPNIYPEVAEYLAHAKLEWLREGSIPETQLYDVIHDLGEAAHCATGYRGCESLRREAEPVVAAFLAHNDPGMRYIAVNVLAHHWGLKRYVQTFQTLGQSDPDEYVRHLAVSAVGNVLGGPRDHDVSRFLLGVLRDPVQPAWIRETAYDGLVKIWQGFDVAHAQFVRKLRREKSQRAEAEKADAAGERAQDNLQHENAWEGFVDWDFVAWVEQAVKDKGRP